MNDKQLIEQIKKFKKSFPDDLPILVNLGNKQDHYVQRVVCELDYDGDPVIKICCNEISDAEVLQRLRTGDYGEKPYGKKFNSKPKNKKSWSDVCNETVGKIGNFSNIDKIGRK